VLVTFAKNFDPKPELVAENQERHFNAVMDIDCLLGSSIYVGVLLDGRDELRDATQGIVKLSGLGARLPGVPLELWTCS
jgi:hypothetical protein